MGSNSNNWARQERFGRVDWNVLPGKNNASRKRKKPRKRLFPKRSPQPVGSTLQRPLGQSFLQASADSNQPTRLTQSPRRNKIR